MRIFILFGCFISTLYSDSFGDLLQKSLENNEKIRQIQYQIQILESQAQSQAKWDNPNISLSYSNAEVPQPFNLSANEMQNIGIGITQNIDMNGKRKLRSNLIKQQVQIKILELKNLKNQYTFSLMQNIVNASRDKHILKFTEDSLSNISTLLRGLQASNNFNPMQIQKLILLKARLEIKKNELENALANSHIAISEISFENLPQSFYGKLWDIMDIKTALQNFTQMQEMDFVNEIMQSNYEIAITQLQNAISRDSIRNAKKGFIPDLGVNFAYMFRIDRADMFTLGISMPIPIWGKESEQVREAHYQNLLQESQVLEVSNKVKHSAKTLFNKIKTLQNNLAIIDSLLIPANQKIIDLYQHHVTSQSGAFLEFYTALNEQIEAEILRLQILSDIVIAYYDLQSLKGEL
ncbi:hypothetical protein CQA66_00770 [Helicobacter aurati]|uniref:TolC family protein n=1 Tax=Helicobacter aurati TaxID=137778 RepID=A0A3D8J8Y5_9HELI|nr:TolC family protein [Helicobacter aurati]RDU73750.1 hypothetical protein CQA66_00770 [Helicobacter aurati]